MESIRNSSDSYPISSHIHQPYGILQRNLLSNSLSYKLKQHQVRCLREQEVPRDLSSAISLHLSDENLDDLHQCLGEVKEVSVTSQCKSGGEIEQKDNAVLDLSKDSTANLPFISIDINRSSQENGLVHGDNRSRQVNKFVDSQFNTSEHFEVMNSKVNVRKRNGIFEPVSQYVTSRKYKENHPLCARQPSGRKYKTFILAGEAIREIKSSQEEKSGDKRKLHFDFNQQSAQHERSEIHHFDDDFAFRRPKFIPPKRDINSIGITWTFPAIEQETTKQQQQSKPIWSWLVAKDNFRDVVRTKAGRSRFLHPHSSPGQEMRGTHSKDIHPVATAMNRQGISTSKVKWAVPTCSSRTGSVDATRFVMERLELVRRPTGPFYDGESILQ